MFDLRRGGAATEKVDRRPHAATAAPPCPDENQIVAFAAGNARGDAARAIEQHMDECAECRLILAQLARSSPPLRSWAEGSIDETWPGLADEYAVGRILDERFCLLGRLGSGGMGQVYEAEDLLLGIRVAIKLLPPQFGDSAMLVSHLYQELLLGRRVSHPNVCRIYDLGKSSGVHFLTMELVDGETLAERLARGPLPHARACHVIEQIVSAMAAAHRAGVVHRDFKPANIMVSQHDLVKVMDFGLARDHRCARRPAPGPVGTPGYWAPEQARGEDATAASDVYALGLVMREILAGPGSRRARASLDSIRQPFRSVIERCLARRPQDRFASAVELETHLRRMARSHERRRARLTALVPGGLAAAVVAVLLCALGRGEPPGPADLAAGALTSAAEPAPAAAEPLPIVLPLPAASEARAGDERPEPRRRERRSRRAPGRTAR